MRVLLVLSYLDLFMLTLQQQRRRRKAFFKPSFLKSGKRWNSLSTLGKATTFYILKRKTSSGGMYAAQGPIFRAQPKQSCICIRTALLTSFFMFL
jgi:hypothetical protein